MTIIYSNVPNSQHLAIKLHKLAIIRRTKIDRYSVVELLIVLMVRYQTCKLPWRTYYRTVSLIL